MNNQTTQTEYSAASTIREEALDFIKRNGGAEDLQFKPNRLAECAAYSALNQCLYAGHILNDIAIDVYWGTRRLVEGHGVKFPEGYTPYKDQTYIDWLIEQIEEISIERAEIQQRLEEEHSGKQDVERHWIVAWAFHEAQSRFVMRLHRHLLRLWEWKEESIVLPDTVKSIATTQFLLEQIREVDEEAAEGCSWILDEEHAEYYCHLMSDAAHYHARTELGLDHKDMDKDEWNELRGEKPKKGKVKSKHISKEVH